jgi:fructoselysine-6-P-deglycase FrlB-like protein
LRKPFLKGIPELVRSSSGRLSPNFLARRQLFGGTLDARLSWEEGVKATATAMGTGRFRHGLQEIVNTFIVEDDYRLLKS